ncbi:hypothetical protein [Bifidobacterium longum]|jgi:hypothetical protein|uniref:Uncharacterized protein n=1 Tax=Bifidobacterium longum subsp. longum TaxID=1679 RepID=A0A4R0RYB4_BIFLL|nr:hypothetical protein [Bifidobacterium longum]TCD72105.1 hypothetical protein MCC10003_2051 [Bifidobacterium longum subsp. longum]TCF00073.1 hypothetical protein MCC10077_0053 [Bifidobacterium longum subsp. longum]TCF47753.1 hypothetical protein MCC10102_0262 [Bifidobacterium longum subsp. longum]
MKTTDIYGLPYIEAGDLVSAAPAQFKTMAEGIETALAEVDSRNTPAGVKPVIATTLEALAAQTGVTGQTGYVTADTTTANNGPYFWNGSAWLPYATGGMLDDLRNQLTQGYESGTFSGQTNGDAVAEISWKSHTTKPAGMVVTRLRIDNQSDDSTVYIVPYLWSLRPGSAWVRFRNNLMNTWATTYAVSFCWFAWWD